MKKATLLLLLVLALSGFKESVAQGNGNWKVGVRFSQDFYKSGFLPMEQWSGYNMEPASFNFTAGVTGQYTLRPKLSLLTGLSYSQKDFNATYSCAVCKYIAAPTPTEMEQRYLEIPALLRYNVLEVLQSKLALYLEAGLLNGYRMNEDTGEVDDSTFDNRYLLSAQTGASISYSFRPRVSLELAGIYRHTLSNNAGDSSDYLNAVGLQTGLNYSF